MEPRPWFIDELTHAGDEHLDPGYVVRYDRKASFDSIPDLDLLRNFGFGSESTLVDLGTGTGDFALAAARTCRRVIAIDIPPAMLVAMRLKMRPLGGTNLWDVPSAFLTSQHQGEQAP